MYGLKKYFFQVVDPNGEPIVSGLKVSILTADGAIATVYSDAIKTELPWVSGVLSSTAYAALGNGIVEFWSAGTDFDIEIVDEVGGHMKVQGFTGADHRIVYDPNRSDCQLVYATTAAGAELVDTEATFVDFPGTVTLSGEELKAGDVIHIQGMVLFADFNSGDTMDLKVLLGTEAILQTGDVTPAANDDTISFDLWVTVNTAGSSGKIKVVGKWETDLNGTVVNHIVAPTGAAKELAEDISGDVLIKCQGDYSAEHEDNEAYLIDLKVFVHHNGNV